MSASATLWLPDGSANEVQVAVWKMVAQWVEDWIADPPPFDVAAIPSGQLVTEWHGAAGTTVGCETGGDSHLGLAICGGQGDLANAGDVYVLERVAGDACAALAVLCGAQTHTAHAQCSSPVPVPGGAAFRVTPRDRSWSVVLKLTDEAIVAARRKAFATGYRPSLGRVIDALEQEPCAVSIHLGHARLFAGELESLGVGDVIVFDRQTDQPLPLLIEDISCQSGSARPTAQGERLSFAVVTPPSLAAQEKPER
ncbi:MAG: FliM/FliN family flagellar motor C-terminal domain-containing protein [Novosphingobium sp.]|uniref:FliM/FliN family flagellar motor C-terminal domain-containing protein n=1 Tax=Novosphingobium sp. TaxID=1874826 RepID=UPI0032B7FD84